MARRSAALASRRPEKAHAVHAGEDEPVVFGQAGDAASSAVVVAAGFRWWEFDDVGTELAQRSAEGIGLIFGARDHDCWPKSGSFSNQLSLSRSSTTSPTMMVAGGFRLCAWMSPGGCESAGDDLLLRACAPADPMAAWRRFYRRDDRSAISWKCERPMKMTRVSEAPTLVQSIFRTSWR